MDGITDGYLVHMAVAYVASATRGDTAQPTPHRIQPDPPRATGLRYVRRMQRLVVGRCGLVVRYPLRSLPRRTVYDVPVGVVEHTIWRDDFRCRFAELPASGVADGDWDMDMVRFGATAFYRALREHFADGLPWWRTRIREALELPSIARRCRKEGGLDAYERFLEDLHASFRRHGYRGGDPLHVLIGREGSFIRYDGTHRLAMAKLTGVIDVPVRVMLRHAAWQTARAAQVRRPTPDAATHPDMESMSLPVVRRARVPAAARRLRVGESL